MVITPGREIVCTPQPCTNILNNPLLQTQFEVTHDCYENDVVLISDQLILAFEKVLVEEEPHSELELHMGSDFEAHMRLARCAANGRRHASPDY